MVIDRDALEEERDFLLRSLDDLASERAEGNIDDATYARLHADYTARAARVLHQLDGDPVPTDSVETGRVSTRRRVLTIGGIVVFAIVVGVVLAFGLGARLPGDTITGRQRETAAAAARRQLATLRADVKANPNYAAARLALARGLMGDQDAAGALRQFQAAAKLDPTNPEPYAYSGWLIRLQGYPADGLTLLDKAIQLNPAYADARFFRGIIMLRDRSDPVGAAAEFRQYLGLAPDSPLAPQVRQLLAEAEAKPGSAPASTTSTTTP